MNLSLTTACNRRCAYCFQKGWYLTKDPIELPLEDVKEIVRRFMSKRREVSLLGGEPLLYSRIVDVLQFLKDSDVYPVIITNASTSNFQDVFERFIDDTAMGFMLNSDYPKVQHDVFVKNFEYLARHRDGICLSTTLLDTRPEQSKALDRCIELRERWWAIKGTYRGLNFRISPYSPNHTGSFDVHNFDDDLFYFLGNLRSTGEIGVSFDCYPTGCEISLKVQDYLQSRGIRFPSFPCDSQSCPLDFLVDGSVIYCSSSPHIKVASWRPYQTTKDLLAELAKVRAEYLKTQVGCSTTCQFYGHCQHPCVSKIKFYKNRVF